MRSMAVFGRAFKQAKVGTVKLRGDLGEFAASSRAFAASPLSGVPDKTAMLRRLRIGLSYFHGLVLQ